MDLVKFELSEKCAIFSDRIGAEVMSQTIDRRKPTFANSWIHVSAAGYSVTPRLPPDGFTRRFRRLPKRSRMDRIARRSPQDRSDLFAETASKLGLRPAIAEKDFWVCLVLNLLFVKSPFRQSLVFKGGTSLSKVYHLIERFSEDIDLIRDWQLIGFGEGLQDPMQNFDSKGKQDRFNKQINQLAAAFIGEQLCPRLDELVKSEKLHLSAAVDSTDPDVINIRYPAAFSEKYIRPEVRLEIGPLASWVPSATHMIQPYAYEVFPNLFENPHTPVVAITAERTFWEKATILPRRRIVNRSFPSDTPGITTIFTSLAEFRARNRVCPDWPAFRRSSLQGTLLSLELSPLRSCDARLVQTSAYEGRTAQASGARLQRHASDALRKPSRFRFDTQGDSSARS